MSFVISSIAVSGSQTPFPLIECLHGSCARPRLKIVESHIKLCGKNSIFSSIKRDIHGNFTT
jgi:hypothetical protein